MKAYRQRALAEHPDKGGDVDRFDALKKAYEVLSDQQPDRNSREAEGILSYNVKKILITRMSQYVILCQRSTTGSHTLVC